MRAKEKNSSLLLKIVNLQQEKFCNFWPKSDLMPKQVWAVIFPAIIITVK
jgi:hypothetical protein